MEEALKNMVVLVDTREQPTRRLKQRLDSLPCAYRRTALGYGDYSALTTLPDGSALDLSGAGGAAVERKMSLDELAQCMTRSRARFSREFERAKDAGAKMYILTENASLDSAYRGDYRTRVTPKALTASMTAWMARYNTALVFCSESISGRVIYDILYRELKERLENIA